MVFSDGQRSLFLFICVQSAVPFEEDERDPSIWFLDHNYHEAMFSMFKRINGMFPHVIKVVA